MSRIQGRGGPPCKTDQPALPSPQLEGLRRRYDLGLQSAGLIYGGPAEPILLSLSSNFHGLPLEPLDLAALAPSLDMDRPGFLRLHRLAEGLAKASTLIVVHGYERRALPHCILLFDYLERESVLSKALSASRSFLIVAWTAQEKESFLSERLLLPGADGGYRDFSFVMQSFVRMEG